MMRILDRVWACHERPRGATSRCLWGLEVDQDGAEALRQARLEGALGRALGVLPALGGLGREALGGGHRIREVPADPVDDGALGHDTPQGTRPHDEERASVALRERVTLHHRDRRRVVEADRMGESVADSSREGQAWDLLVTDVHPIDVVVNQLPALCPRIAHFVELLADGQRMVRRQAVGGEVEGRRVGVRVRHPKYSAAVSDMGYPNGMIVYQRDGDSRTCEAEVQLLRGLAMDVVEGIDERAGQVLAEERHALEEGRRKELSDPLQQCLACPWPAMAIREAQHRELTAPGSEYPVLASGRAAVDTLGRRPRIGREADADPQALDIAKPFRRRSRTLIVLLGVAAPKSQLVLLQILAVPLRVQAVLGGRLEVEAVHEVVQLIHTLDVGGVHGHARRVELVELVQAHLQKAQLRLNRHDGL
mmetsp:Transcript_127341/g.407617  ORF Transcript_127341/g.407617 Transcript_127341/m.407617 type:complete len:422 (-) Transcript_127341:375-1640(-)